MAWLVASAAAPGPVLPRWPRRHARRGDRSLRAAAGSRSHTATEVGSRRVFENAIGVRRKREARLPSAIATAATISVVATAKVMCIPVATDSERALVMSAVAEA